MAISTIGTTLKIGDVTYDEIKTFPALGGNPEQIESTSMKNHSQTFVPGVQAMEAMNFVFNWDKSKFTALKAQEGSSEDLDYTLTFSDGTKNTWSGKHVVFINEGAVNGLIEFTLSVTPSTDITTA